MEKFVPLLIETHIEAICKLSEAYISSVNEKSAAGYAAKIAHHERVLQDLGLTQAEVYSWVNRAAVPAQADARKHRKSASNDRSSEECEILAFYVAHVLR